MLFGPDGSGGELSRSISRSGSIDMGPGAASDAELEAEAAADAEEDDDWGDDAKGEAPMQQPLQGAVLRYLQDLKAKKKPAKTSEGRPGRFGMLRRAESIWTDSCTKMLIEAGANVLEGINQPAIGDPALSDADVFPLLAELVGPLLEEGWLLSVRWWCPLQWVLFFGSVRWARSSRRPMSSTCSTTSSTSMAPSASSASPPRWARPKGMLAGARRVTTCPPQALLALDFNGVGPLTFFFIIAATQGVLVLTWAFFLGGEGRAEKCTGPCGSTSQPGPYS